MLIVFRYDGMVGLICGGCWKFCFFDVRSQVWHCPRCHTAITSEALELITFG